MTESDKIREAISSAGILQEMIDRILLYGVAPRWLPIQVACFYAGIGEKKILKHIENGDIYATLDGGKWLIDRASIDEYFLQDKKRVENILANLSQKR
ncbi:MAG TPA: hypothetical protein VL122_06075 [Nitrospirota bacterium]|nr:hypothetical protein [Nitrospirota bacterium]